MTQVCCRTFFSPGQEIFIFYFGNSNMTRSMVKFIINFTSTLFQQVNKNDFFFLIAIFNTKVKNPIFRCMLKG